MARIIVSKPFIGVATYCRRDELNQNASGGGSAMKKTEGQPDQLEAAVLQLATSTRILKDTRKFEAAKNVYIAAGYLHDLRCDVPTHNSALIVEAFDNAIAALRTIAAGPVSFRKTDFVNNISRWRHLAGIHG
jgi:hypothetical protein